MRPEIKTLIPEIHIKYEVIQAAKMVFYCEELNELEVIKTIVKVPLYGTNPFGMTYRWDFIGEF